MHRLRYLPPLLLAAAALSAAAADRNLVWANRGSDMNAAASWDDAATGEAATEAPTSADRLFFPGRPGVQPRLTASLEVRAVCFGPVGSSGRTEADTGDGYGGFDHCGWTITGASGAELRIPGSWNEGKNWNFAFSQASYGTNTVAVPVRFTNAGGGYRPVMPSHGRLVFAAAVASDSAAATVLCNGEDGFVELAAANPELACAIQTDAACSLCFSHPQALSAVTRLVLNDNTYPVRTARFRNETGAPAQITSVAEIAQTQNTADLHFEGAAMSFPNATFRQDGSKGRRLYSLDVPVTVRSLGNAVSNAGAYGFWKLGAAPLRVTGDVFGDAPEGQTNRLVVLDGALVLEDGGYLSRDRIVFGGNGDPEKIRYEPTIIYPVDASEEIVRHELFNPLLPIVTYPDDEVDSLTDLIAEREHGLALYLFTKDMRWAKKTMSSQQYGGGCINEVCLHLMVKGAPFNGTGHSGMGAYHGEWGFREFTHPQTVLFGSTKFNLPLREHPYSGLEGDWKLKALKIFQR